MQQIVSHSILPAFAFLNLMTKEILMNNYKRLSIMNVLHALIQGLTPRSNVFVNSHQSFGQKPQTPVAAQLTYCAAQSPAPSGNTAVIERSPAVPYSRNTQYNRPSLRGHRLAASSFITLPALLSWNSHRHVGSMYVILLSINLNF
jgi:hypothetical protein